MVSRSSVGFVATDLNLLISKLKLKSALDEVENCWLKESNLASFISKCNSPDWKLLPDIINLKKLSFSKKFFKLSISKSETIFEKENVPNDGNKAFLFTGYFLPKLYIVFLLIGKFKSKFCIELDFIKKFLNYHPLI